MSIHWKNCVNQKFGINKEKSIYHLVFLLVSNEIVFFLLIFFFWKLKLDLNKWMREQRDTRDASFASFMAKNQKTHSLIH